MEPSFLKRHELCVCVLACVERWELLTYPIEIRRRYKINI